MLQRQLRFLPQIEVRALSLRRLNFLFSLDDVHAQFMASLRSRLVPYFYFIHPSRGRLPGPFRKLPSSQLRRLALDVTVMILSPKKRDDASYDSLLQAISLAVAGEVEEKYWSHVSTRLKAF
jgi:pre-rRNA-processing protein IPI1